jgi:hypothetical protein
MTYLIGCRPTPGLDELLPELPQLHHAARLRGMRHAHLHSNIINTSLADPNVFGSPGSGSGSDSQTYGSGSFYHQAKIV